MKLTRTATKVIDLANKIQNYWNMELPKRHPNYPMISVNEDSGPPPPEQKKLKNLLAKLPDDDVYKLLLVMYLGRGDFGTDDLASQFTTLKNRFAKPEWAVSQMMQKATLGEYLAEGLSEANASGIDLDHLTTTSVNSG